VVSNSQADVAAREGGPRILIRGREKGEKKTAHRHHKSQKEGARVEKKKKEKEEHFCRDVAKTRLSWVASKGERKRVLRAKLKLGKKKKKERANGMGAFGGGLKQRCTEEEKREGHLSFVERKGKKSLAREKGKRSEFEGRERASLASLCREERRGKKISPRTPRT